ncbi:MAG: hypothetical protein AAGA77_00650 [Bacteroidota bacterium]
MDKKFDIVYIVSHGFAARMIMQTNLLGRLVSRNLRVALISPDKEDENLKKYSSEQNVSLFQFNAKSGFWTSTYATSRMYLFENIYKNPALHEKYIRKKRVGFDEGLKFWLKIRVLKGIHDLKLIFPIIKRIFEKVEKNVLRSEEATHFLQSLSPSLLVSTYPVNFIEGRLLAVANDLQIDTVIHLLSWDNITSKGKFPALAKWYIAWGSIMEEEFMEYYNIERKNISVCGVPHFDIHFENPIEKKDEKDIIFFAMSAQRFVPNEIDIVEFLAEKTRNGAFGQKAYLVVRPHPQNVSGDMTEVSWIDRLKQIRGDRVLVDFPEMEESSLKWSMKHRDMYSLSERLRTASVCINSGSTITIEAVGVNTPTIITSFDGNEERDYWDSARRHKDSVHLKKMYSLGAVDICTNYDELVQKINYVIQNSSHLMKERSDSFQLQCFAKDGKSTLRVIEALTKLLC